MRRSLGSIALLVVGCVSLAVGVGLGPAHASKEGLGPVALGGFLLILGGLVSALWGARRVLGATRRRWWLVTVPLMLLGASVCLWTLGQAVAASFPPRPDLGTRTPDSLGLTYRDVTFESRDGVLLRGWYVPSENGAGVVLLHGAGSTRSSVLDHAGVLARHGYGVLLFDARGHGQSAGRGMDFGWFGESDTRGAIDFLSAQPEISSGRIGLVGLSMGGETAVGTAGADRRVAAVVAEGATNRVAEDKAYLSRYGHRGEAQHHVDRLTSQLTDLLTSAPRPAPLRDSVEAAAHRSSPAAFLLITAGDDPDEGYAADHLCSGAPTVCEVWTVPGAGHTHGLRVAGPQWEERVTGLLDRTLR
ncbi:alpha/beta fold hydrolase [Sanguibacter sp. 25GB23B1]|uniref:alpha/beta hydrolase n=1 Tax=unclassified Sanguibacter TaxID=2645534 RepID=UPI0032AF750A